MASIIKRLWSGSDFWDKEENKQQRQQYAAPRPQPEMEQKIKTARYGVLANNPQRQQQFIQDTKATPGPSILSTVHNAINDTLNANTQADQQRRLSQGLPRYYQDQSNLSKITRAAETGGRVTARVLQGIGQDTLGTYDLLTPGHGINRATKYYQNRGAQTDQEVKDMGLDENVYKAGQVPLALGSYMIPGKAVSNVGKIPRVARAGAAVERVVSKVPGATKAIGALDDLAANGDRFQRVTSRLVRSYTRPGNIADVGVDALQNAGHRTSLGQDNSLSTAGLDIGMSLGMQGGLNLAGQAVAPAIQTTTRLAKNTANNLMDSVAPVQTTTRLVKRTNRLNLDTTDALKAYSDMLVDADPYIQGKIRSDLIARVRDIGDQLGVDLTNGSVADKMERIEAILNGYLPVTETRRKLALTPLGEATGSVPIGSPLIPIPKKLQNKLSGVDPEADYIKKIRQPIEKELKDAQAEMDKYGTGYINDIDRAAQQAKAKARLDRAKEADWQNSESNILARQDSIKKDFEYSTKKLKEIAEGVEYRQKSEPWYQAREDIKSNYINKFKSADDFVADFNTNEGVIPKDIKLAALGDKQYTSKEEMINTLTDFYNEAHSGKAMSVDPVAMTEEQYLAQNGAGFMEGSDPALHRQPKKRANAQTQDVNRVMDSMGDNNARRAELRKEYQDKVKSGELRPPTFEENIIERANGHPDLESTKAARRLAEKKGINWEKADLDPLESLKQEAKRLGYDKGYTEEGQIANTIDELMKEQNAVREVGIPLYDKYKNKLDGTKTVTEMMTPAELKAYRAAEAKSEKASKLLKDYFDYKKGNSQSQPPKSTPKAEAPDPLESLKQEARKYKSAEEFIDTDKTISVPIRDFPKTDTTSWNEALNNVSKGELSKTAGPVEVVLTPNGYKLVEGNHRAVQALQSGKDSIEAKIISKEGLEKIAQRDGPHIKMNMQDSLTRQQLTDLYNQATQSQPPRPTATTKVENATKEQKVDFANYVLTNIRKHEQINSVGSVLTSLRNKDYPYHKEIMQMWKKWSRYNVGKPAAEAPVNKLPQQMTREEIAKTGVMRVGDADLPTYKTGEVIGDAKPLKKGNVRPDAMRTQSGYIVQYEQYKQGLKRANHIEKRWNEQTKEAAINEARHRNDSMNLAIFEHSDNYGDMERYLFGEEINGHDLKLTYTGKTREFGAAQPSQPPKSTPKKTSKQYKDAKIMAELNAQDFRSFSAEERGALQDLTNEYVGKMKGKNVAEAKQIKTEYDRLISDKFDGKQWTDAENDIDYAIQEAYDNIRKAPQPTKVATPFEKDLQAVGLAPSPQAKGSVGIPSRSTPKKPQRLEVPSDQTTELPRLRQSKANPANQPSNRNEVLSKETPVNAVDSTTNTKNTKPGLESRTPKKSLKTPQEKPVVSGTSRKLSTPEVKQPQNLQQPSTTASAGVGGQAVSKTQPEAYKQPKESQVSQNQVQSQESSSKTRGFIKSVLEDPNTNPKVKESISSLYTVRNTKELQTKAATLVKEHPDIAEQMSKSANDDASVAVAMELVKKHQNAGDYTRAIDLVESVAKDLTEAGRTVQAASIYGRLTPEGILRFTQKEINNYNKATGKDIKLTPKAADTLKTMADDLQKMPDGYDKDVAVAKMIAEVQKTMPATTAEKISTFQTMAQLLNPKTIIRNELGNSAFLGLENISQTVATPVDALMSLFTGKRTTTLPSVKTQVKGLIEGRKKGVSEAFQGINTGASTQYDLNSVPVFRGKVLGNLEKTMGAALRGGDRANYTAAFDDSLKGSMKLAKTKTATPEMLEAAHHAGLYRTFQDQNVISNFFVGMKKTLNTVGIGIKGKRFGLGDMVLKYPKTPANLLARGIDYSPAGFVKTVFEMSKPLFGKQFDQKVFVDSLSRATTGTAGLVGTGAMLGSLGIITEAPEKDKDLRDLQKQSGLGGYQINVSGLKRFVASGFSKDAAKLREGDKLVSYDWAQPAAIPVSMGAAIGKGKGAKEGAGKSVSALTEGIQTITEQPMVRGLQQFFGSNKGAGGIVGDLLKDTPASFIPTLSNQVRQLTDNTNRNTYDPSVLTESMNRVKNKIPGLASSVPARIGSLGETRENYQNGSNNPFNVFFNPSFVSNYDPKETAKLPLGINQRTGEVKQAPRSISTTQTVNGKSVKITAQQNQDLQKYVGTETDKAFSQLMKNPAFMALSDEEKANKMGTLITNINKAGKVLILGDEGYGTDSYKPTKLDRGVRDVLGGKYDYSTRSMKTGAASPDYAQQYADLKADFNDPSNGWSDVQKVAKTKELKRLEIKKDYDADTVALHSMSKADMYAYVSKAKNGKQLAEKLIAYDNALYEAGLSQYRKYKNGIAPASKGGGRKSGGRGGKRKAIPKDLMAKAMDVPKVAQLRQSKITAKQPQARSFKTRRKAIPKIAKSTPKLTVKRTQTA